MDKVVIIPVDIMFPNARVHTRVCEREQFFSKIILGAFQTIISIFQKIAQNRKRGRWPYFE